MSRPQGSAGVSHAPILKREDGRIDWGKSAQEIYNRMRGFTPWPGAYTDFRRQTCHVWGRPFDADAMPASRTGSGESPGTLVHEHGNLWVTCGAATRMQLSYVKLEGRKRISAAEFANGARLQPGERFGQH
jgi:methionyl-tRNA formyltransferase